MLINTEVRYAKYGNALIANGWGCLSTSSPHPPTPIMPDISLSLFLIPFGNTELNFPTQHVSWLKIYKILLAYLVRVCVFGGYVLGPWMTNYSCATSIEMHTTILKGHCNTVL